MPILTRLVAYEDRRGNVIEMDGEVAENIRITIKGSNNRLVIASPHNIGRLHVSFDCDNGYIQLGSSRGVPSFKGTINCEQDCNVIIGNNVSMTGLCIISAAEGTDIRIGDDVMISSKNSIRSEDGHPIFDVKTEKRTNVSRSITIGDHVWLSNRSVVLGGATVGHGTVIGHSAVVTRFIPNNCIAAGIPARVVRSDVVWERAHLSLVEPFYKPDSGTVHRSHYWRATDAGQFATTAVTPRKTRKLLGFLRGLG